MAMSVIDEAYAAFERGDAALAISLFESADRQESDQGALMLGWIYETGWNVPVDLNVAMSFYRKAAARESSQGNFYLGRMLLEMCQYDEAFHFLGTAAIAEPAAAHMLGRCARLPLSERIYWLEKGVAVDNVYCLALSGRLLLRQAPVKNLAKAMWRIVRAFVVTVFVGIAFKKVSDLHEDKRFQK
jgi:tetratricopeptide (TPR) repeat protein